MLRDAEGPTGILSAVAFAGAIVFAGGAIVGATIHFALADYSDNTDVVDPQVFQTLNAFDWSNFLFFPVGLGTMLLCARVAHAPAQRSLGTTSRQRPAAVVRSCFAETTARRAASAMRDNEH